jgi:hypothetical protein
VLLGIREQDRVAVGDRREEVTLCGAPLYAEYPGQVRVLRDLSKAVDIPSRAEVRITRPTVILTLED